VTPTSDILIEKYTRQQRVSVFQRLGHRKRERSPEWEEVYGRWPEASRSVEKGCYAGLRQAMQRVPVKHSADKVISR
jgi:hypothetical protein